MKSWRWWSEDQLYICIFNVVSGFYKWVLIASLLIPLKCYLDIWSIVLQLGFQEHNPILNWGNSVCFDRKISGPHTRDSVRSQSPREELVTIQLTQYQCMWLSRKLVSACCCLWGESCNTLTGYRTEGKQIELPVIITPPSIIITLFSWPLFIATVSPPIHLACLMVSHSLLTHVSA